SFLGQLRRRDARPPAFCRGPWLVRTGRTGLGVRLLPAGGRLAAAVGNRFPRSGVPAFIVRGLPNCFGSIRTGVRSHEGVCALGVADRASVCGRNLDSSGAHANAGHIIKYGMTMRSLRGGLIFGWLLVGPWCASTRGDGGTVRLMATKGSYQIT